MMHTLFEDNRIFVLGHRGCSEFFPENTMVSFEDCAKDERIDGIELDVHLCKSGEVVVSHDSSLKRTAGLDLVIEKQSWNDLRKIDVGSFKDRKFSDEHLPLLEDVFSTFQNRFIYDIELKVDGFKLGRALCLAVWSLIQKYQLEEKVMVSSFNPFALKRFNRACWYSVPTADIFFDGTNMPKSLRHGFGHVISGSSYLKPALDVAFQKYSPKNRMSVLPLVVWTVNSEEDVKKCLALKNLKGLIGNNPHMLCDSI